MLLKIFRQNVYREEEKKILSPYCHFIQVVVVVVFVVVVVVVVVVVIDCCC